MRALSDAGERQASTQPPDHTLLICLLNRGGKSDKGQAFECDKEGTRVLLLALALTLAIHCKRPSRGQKLTATAGVFTHRYESDPVLPDIECAGVYLHVVSLRQ